ncbi:uncharacterized protein LOC142093027 isoform X1 [Calonectris borealis]|uniref:uncharacterized protein LOC142093027 isoform X1 n=1 Tax=Calonectris borealis TaxID=1323832 RepID=UPI003F4C189D
MGRQRGPPVPRWRQLLCVGCWWLLSLSGTALQGLRWLWRLAWVGTPSPRALTHLRWFQTWRVSRTRGRAGGGRCCPGSVSVPGAVVRCGQGSGGGKGGVATPSSGSVTEGLGPSSSGVGSWLEALYSSVHQELWGRGDIAPGSALPGVGLSLPLSPCGRRPLPQYLLICYKSCWDGAFQVTEELGTALQMRLESGSEGSEEDGGSTSALESEQAVAEQWQRGDASEAVLGRLEALEADVRFLCTELGAEKLLWSSRFLELLQEQQGLRQRVSPPWGPQPPRSPLVPWTLMAHPSCRNARGGGTAATAPSCQGKRRTNVPVGAMERARQDAGGWNHPGSRPRAQAVFWGQRLHDRQKISSRALPRPACSAELQPFPRSRNHPGGSSRQAAASCAAQGRSQLPRAHGHPRGCLCLGTLSLVEPSKEHLPDPLQLVGSFQERRVRPLPALGDTGAMDGLQNPSAAPFTSSLAR